MSESDEREELLRRRAELEERIEFLERQQDSDGLAQVKAEGAAIVAARERDLERERAASVEPDGGVEPVDVQKPKKKRDGGNPRA